MVDAMTGGELKGKTYEAGYKLLKESAINNY